MSSLRLRRLGGFGSQCVDDTGRVREVQGPVSPAAQHFRVGEKMGFDSTAQEECSVRGGM